MFPKINRINSQDFKRVYSLGKKHSTTLFRARVLPESFGVAVVISRRCSKKRTTRNREKRRISHILKEILSKRKTDCKIILWAQKDTTNLPSSFLKEELIKLLSKANII